MTQGDWFDRMLRERAAHNYAATIVHEIRTGGPEPTATYSLEALQGALKDAYLAGFYDGRGDE